MQRCPHCSETLDGPVPICGHCGREVDAAPSTLQGSAPAAVPDPPHEQNLFDQVWFEDAAAPSHHTTAPDADFETWSTLEVPAAASALDSPTAAPPAVEPSSNHAAPVPATRPRWQLPAIGLGGVGTVAVVLSLMGRPGSNAGPASAATPITTTAAAQGAASAPAGSAATAAQPASATALPPPAPSTPSAVVVDEAPAWIVPRRTNWGPDGTRTLTLQLQALGDIRAGREQVRPVLAVRCLARRTDVFVAIGTSASIEGGDTHTVTVQFDDQAPVKQQWPGSASYQELFAPDGMAVARRLAETRMLRVTFTPFRARAVTAEFNVQGFDRHVKDVARLCGWPAQDAAAGRRGGR